MTRPALLLLGVLAMTTPALSAEPTAAEMMRRAHAARAEWHDLEGFTATVTLRVDGRASTGLVHVRGDEVKFEVKDNPDPAWFDRRLESFVSHQMARGGDDEYDVSFADDDTDHPLGRLIAFNEDRLHSHYRIKEDVITEVHRTMGETRFTITVLDVGRTPEGKVHSNLYDVSYWNTKTGQLTKSEVFRNDWHRVGGLPMPKRLLTVSASSDGERTVREIVFDDVELVRTGGGE